MMASSPRPGQTIPGRGEQPGQRAGAAHEQAAGESSLEEQFESLYTTYYPRILGYLCRLLGDREQAEDAAQETFLRAWRRFGRLRPNSRVSSWLYRIARNHAFDLLRRRALIAWQSLQDLDAEDDGQVREYDQVEVALLLQKAFDLLPPQHKQVLALWNGERSPDQMAAILQTTAGTARNRLSRARAAWRQSYAALAPEGQP
jgi:RNA polymerase sigma factor (sigma-70 family)